MLKLKLQYSGWPPHVKCWLIGKDSDAGRDWGQEEKVMTEDEMAGWHHWFDGRESEWTPGVGDGQRGLACCDSWCCKESDTTERLNWTELRPTDCHTERSMSDRERQILYSISYMWNPKKGYQWTYLQSRDRITYVENKLKVTKWGRGVGQIGRLGLTYTLLYTKWITTKDLLYTTGNSTQCSVMTHMEK